MPPTPEQLDSRKEVESFLERMKKVGRKLSAFTKSEWFGRPDNELQGWIERGRAIHEIEDTMGYQLITRQTDLEITWAQQQLEICDEHMVRDLRSYLKALRFLKDFIITTTKNADISSSVLSERAIGIGRDSHTFVKNARVESAN